MKKLLKYMTPPAPDDSGASGVLFELGGIIVVCDAGGCTGNICGFDEPRWENRKSALFSAGLRDMDAVLGRDDKLVEKLSKAAKAVKAQFCAIIGTPVPAVIATDYRALKRMTERKTDLPCICIDTDGTKLYDKGEKKTYLQLFKTFCLDGCEKKQGKIGVIGATPLNISETSADRLKAAVEKNGGEAVCFGMGSDIEAVKRAGECEKNIVISPSGIAAAEYLKERFGIPYETAFPCLTESVVKAAQTAVDKAKKVLIIHQQFAANALRERILETNCNCEVNCAGWFAFEDKFSRPNDFHIKDETELVEKVKAENYDVVIADKACKRVLKGFEGEFVDFPHFALSGRLYDRL